MDQNDYFAPHRYTPPEKRSPNTRALIVLAIIIGAIALLAGAGYIAYSRANQLLTKRSAEQAQANAVEIPAVAVHVGKALKWRELARFDWEASVDHPRPTMCIGEFDGDGRDELLLIDYQGQTQLIGLDGSSRAVKDAKWLALAQFQAWDYDRNGTAELVPGTLFFAYQPKVNSYVRIRGVG